MWTKYFKFVKLRRGRVITPRHGEIDFSRDDISLEICQKLYEEDFPYLEITEEGKRELYGIGVETPTSTASRSVGDAPVEEVPIRPDIPASEPQLATKRKYKKRN